MSIARFVKDKEDNKCGITYKKALKELIRGKATIDEDKYRLIKDKVREALIAKKLISKDIYKGYEYNIEGDTIDVARFASGNPECFIKPKYKGKVHFYELYINNTVPYSISSSEFQNKIARLLATIELLESKKIFIKVNMVISAEKCNNTNKPNLLLIVPMFSHKVKKSIKTLSSVINERMLRKFYFAIVEDMYGKDLCSSYGEVYNLRIR